MRTKVVKYLRYEMLNRDEKLRYAEITNRADPKWAKKADDAENKQKNLLRIILLGKSGYLYQGIKAFYHFIKYWRFDQPHMDTFVNEMKEKYRCSKIDVDSFPSNWLMNVSLYDRIPWEKIEGAETYKARKEILQPIIDNSTKELLPERSRKDLIDSILSCENLDKKAFFEIVGEKINEEEERQFSK